MNKNRKEKPPALTAQIDLQIRNSNSPVLAKRKPGAALKQPMKHHSPQRALASRSFLKSKRRTAPHQALSQHLRATKLTSANKKETHALHLPIPLPRSSIPRHSPNKKA
jgi:hypothetical protein